MQVTSTCRWHFDISGRLIEQMHKVFTARRISTPFHAEKLHSIFYTLNCSDISNYSFLQHVSTACYAEHCTIYVHLYVRLISADTNKDDLEWLTYSVLCRLHDRHTYVVAFTADHERPNEHGPELSVTKIWPMNCSFWTYEVCTHFCGGLLQRDDELEWSC